MLKGRRPFAMRHSARAGFTLIELLVAMTLLGVLVKLALPSFTAWIRNAQIRTVAEALQNGVRTAQGEALRLNRPVVMSFTNSTTAPAANAPWPVAVNGINWWLQTMPQLSETSGKYITSGVFADVASGVTISSGLQAVCFNSNGRLVAKTATETGVPGATCTASPVTFAVNQTNADRYLRVTLTVGGQVRMCDPQRPALSATSPDGC